MVVGTKIGITGHWMKK